MANVGIRALSCVRRFAVRVCDCLRLGCAILVYLYFVVLFVSFSVLGVDARADLGVYLIHGIGHLIIPRVAVMLVERGRHCAVAFAERMDVA